jgi:hypothetical protein
MTTNQQQTTRQRLSRLVRRGNVGQPRERRTGVNAMADPISPRTVPELISDLTSEITTLFSKEGQLLRSEISDKITQLQSGALELVAGAVCMLVALIILLQAVVIGLTNLGLGAGWSALIVGGVVAIIGAILLLRGAKNIKPKNLTPERTATQLSRDAELVKEKVR